MDLLSWFRRRPVTHAQTDAERQGQWADWSRAVGEGRMLGDRPGFIRRLVNALGPVEERALTSLPWSTGGTLDAPFARPSAESALALGAVYSAISLLARTVAGLPLHAYREANGKKTELPQLPHLFDQPSVQGDLFDWLHRCMTSLALYGNAYGLVTDRDGFGYPLGIEWLSPEHMTVVDFAFTGPGSFLDPIWRWRGRTIAKENLVHIAWFTRPWKVLGLSPLGAYAASVNTGLGAQKFSADWFAAGGVPPGTFKNAVKTVPREEAQEIKARLVDSIRSHQPIVYGADWDYNPIAVNPQEAQFIETMKLTATQIAVIYGVPPERIGGEKGHSMTYANTEQESIDFVQFTVLNYAKKLESAFFKLLPARQYVRFNLDALIRTDLKTRHQVYMLDRQMGLRNIDEIRDMENLPPLPNGEGEDYAPLLKTGLAIDPNEVDGGTSGPGADDSPGALSQVAKPLPRRPYQDAPRNGNGQHRLWDQMEPITVHNHINVPERQVTVENHVQPAAPAEVQVPVTVSERQVTVENNVQPANAPVVTAPITVNTPEVQVSPPDVTVQPAVVNVAIPAPEKAKVKQITTKRNADGSSTATIKEN